MQPTNDQLIKKLRKQGIVYQILQLLMMAMIAVGFVLTVTIQNNANQKVLVGLQRQNSQLQSAVADLKADNNRKLDEQTKHLRCIAEFFTKKDRTDLTIDNIDQCLITKNGAQVTSSLVSR